MKTGLNKTFTATVLLAGTVMASASIQAREFADIYTECGLGALIAPNNSAVAAVTNVTWDLGTTAVSSNASSPDTCNGGKEKTAAFIYKSYDSLEKDIAMGSGKYLDRLIAMLGGEGSDSNAMIDAIRLEFGKLAAMTDFDSMTRFDKSRALFNIVENQRA